MNDVTNWHDQDMFQVSSRQYLVALVNTASWRQCVRWARGGGALVWRAAPSDVLSSYIFWSFFLMELYSSVLKGLGLFVHAKNTKFQDD